MIRRATTDDLSALFDLVWPRAGELCGVGGACPCATYEHLNDMIGGEGVVFVNGDTSAAGAVLLSDAPMTRQRVAYGLWLVADRVGEGLKIAKHMVRWSREQEAVPVCGAKSNMVRFYERLGMKPLELVYAGIG